LNPHESAPIIGISIDSVFLTQLNRVSNTHTHEHTDTQTTLRATSVAIGRTYALRSVDAA